MLILGLRLASEISPCFSSWLRIAAGLYGVASLLAIPAVLGNRPKGHKYCIPVALGAWFFHLVASVEMLASAHHLIPVMADEIVSTLALAIVAVFLFTFFVYRTVTFGLFALPLAFLLTVVPAIGPERYTFSSPLVRNGWIAFHVVMLLAAYAALLFSMLSSFLYLIQEKRLKGKDWAKVGRVAPAETAAAGVSDMAASAGDHGSDRDEHVANRFCLHDGWVVRRVTDCAGASGHRVFRRSQGAAVLRDVGTLRCYIVHPAERGTARAPGRVADVGGFCSDPLRLGCEHAGFRSLFRAQVWTEMRFLVTGLNHTTAPVELRERLAIAKEVLPETTRALLSEPGVKEAMILSTCNRVELLVSHNGLEPHLPEFLAEHFRLDRSMLEPHLYRYQDEEAVRHMFRVAASLDSMVVGEAQILGQVKQSWTMAREMGAVKGPLDKLLQGAFSAAKRVRTETEIGSSSVSIASVGGRFGAADFWFARRQEGSDRRRGQDERAGGAAPDAARRRLDDGGESHV